MVSSNGPGRLVPNDRARWHLNRSSVVESKGGIMKINATFRLYRGLVLGACAAFSVARASVGIAAPPGEGATTLRVPRGAEPAAESVDPQPSCAHPLALAELA